MNKFIPASIEAVSPQRVTSEPLAANTALTVANPEAAEGSETGLAMCVM